MLISKLQAYKLCWKIFTVERLVLCTCSLIVLPEANGLPTFEVRNEPAEVKPSRVSASLGNLKEMFYRSVCFYKCK